MHIILITGPPYSGKGTQAEIIEYKYGYRHISTGDRIRREKENKTSIGRIMSSYSDKGELVPDEVMKNLLSDILDEKCDQPGILLDGYPRTTNQVKNLLDLTKEKNHQIIKVLNITVDKEELLVRAAKRAESSDRIDDQDINTHIKRIEVFTNLTIPAIDELRKETEVININGMGTIKEITQRIEASM